VEAIEALAYISSYGDGVTNLLSVSFRTLMPKSLEDFRSKARLAAGGIREYNSAIR
jgi:hypothetical protein